MALKLYNVLTKLVKIMRSNKAFHWLKLKIFSKKLLRLSCLHKNLFNRLIWFLRQNNFREKALKRID